MSFTHRFKCVLPKDEKRKLPLHVEVLDKPCIPYYLEVGERGLIRFLDDDGEKETLHTSTIFSKSTDDYGNITIETRNTVYILEEVKSDLS